MRICFVTSNPVYGAVEDYLRILATGVITAGHEAAIVHPDVPALAPLGIPGATLFRIGTDLSARDMRAEVGRAVEATGCDIVHINDIRPEAMTEAVRLRPGRALCTFHTPSMTFDYHALARRRMSMALRSGIRFIFTSLDSLELAVRRYGIEPELGTVIHLGVEAERFAFDRAEARASVRAELGLDPEAVVAINVGRLCEQKDQLGLIAAFAAIDHPDSRLLIVGDGPHRDAVREKATERVVLTGWRDAVPRLLAAADLFVLSSRFEGLCIAVIEAMAAGLPVVAYAVDGVKEDVDDDRTGRLVTPGDAAALSLAMAELIASSESRAAHGAAGRERYEELFRANRMVSSTLELYKGLLA